MQLRARCAVHACALSCVWHRSVSVRGVASPQTWRLSELASRRVWAARGAEPLSLATRWRRRPGLADGACSPSRPPEHVGEWGGVGPTGPSAAWCVCVRCGLGRTAMEVALEAPSVVDPQSD